MNITFNESGQSFRLSSGGMSYEAAIVDEGYLAHVFFGKSVPDGEMEYLLRLDENPYTPSKNNRDRAVFTDCCPFEYPCFGIGDYRSPALRITDKNGMSAVDLRYVSHSIKNGKPRIDGMPSTFGEDSMTLSVLMHDATTGLEAELLYSVFENLPVICRSVRFTNRGEAALTLDAALSASVDFDGSAYDMLTLNGSWARERHVQRVPLHTGIQSVGSVRGESSHQCNPFFALAEHNADEKSGNVYGFSFVYSGNFLALAEVTQHGCTRAQLGINPDAFSWRLEVGESFSTPEAVMVYSDGGLGKMSRVFHDLWRTHIIRSSYKFLPRPILVNNWEATYFSFDDDKLLDIAREASALGIEMLVMDDGWFGHRDSDNSSLGDWFVYEKKLKRGLPQLVRDVNALGMKFGIWFEPEMVSPDSELFRAHPDWAIRIPERGMTLCREQYVLDYSRAEVRDYVYSMMKSILDSANIEYVKWDMNRQLTEVGSASLPPERQKELWHRYVLGVYELMERLVTDYPRLLLENCSGGGARFDPAMLYYSPQIWCSDDTDAIERIEIQYGTSMVYPVSSIGSHVSVCPNHTAGRTTPFETRGNVALSGTFGYELDITKLSDSEKDIVRQQIQAYKKYARLVLEGDLFRLGVPDERFAAWGFVSKDKTEALFTYVQIRARINTRSRRLKLDGLDADSFYIINGSQRLSGAALMEYGVNLGGLWGDYASGLLHLTVV